jgi:hypothetical protein
VRRASESAASRHGAKAALRLAAGSVADMAVGSYGRVLRPTWDALGRAARDYTLHPARLACTSTNKAA